MNIQEPLRISEIDLNKIVYTKTKTVSNKKIILIKYNDKNKNKNFVFQTPTLLNLFKPTMADGYANMEVALTDKNTCNNFIDFIDKLDQKIKEDARVNASNWFNLSENNQTINYQKIIRESSNFDKGVLKLKLLKNNDFETIIQLSNNKKINICDIPEEYNCKVLLELFAVWVNPNNNFGVFLRPVLVSFEPRNSLYNYKLIDDMEDSEDIQDNILETEVNNTNMFMKPTDVQQESRFDDSTSQIDLVNLLQKTPQHTDKPMDIFKDLLNESISDSSSETSDSDKIELDAETSD
jgi:hypothetical protein